MVISIALQKGGVGKTTTCVNVAVVLSQSGKRVLVVDMDSQSNATMSFGMIPEDYIGTSVLEALLGDMEPQKCIYKSKYGVDVMPANDNLSGLVVTLLRDPKKYKTPMHLLKAALDKVKENYDYIIIDTPPEKGFFTINAFTASDSVLITMQCEARAASGINGLLRTIADTKKAYNQDIRILGIVPTMFNRNTNISHTTLQQARRYFDNKIKVFDTVIYRTVKFTESDLHNQPAVVYSDNEQVQNYKELVKEVFGVA
jgi:chromosome partitioning protein